MRSVRLGRTDLQVSVVALGCGNFGGVGSIPELVGRGDDEAAAFALMDAARERGITFFDTANSYGLGRSEEWIGRWFANRRGARDEIVLTTKVRSKVGTRREDEGLSARHIHEQVDASLRRLGTDWIDLYLAHAPDPSVPIDETLGAFDALVRSGKVRHAGLSNYDGESLAEALDAARVTGAVPPANLQSGYSLLERDAAETFSLCAEHGIAFTAYSPLAGGWLSGKYRAGETYPAGSRMTVRPDPYRHLEKPSTFEALDGLGRAAVERGVQLPALALAWVLTDPNVAAAVVGPRVPAQLGTAIDAAELRLDAADRAELEGLVLDAGH